MEKIEFTGTILRNGKMDVPLRVQLIDWCNSNKGRDVKVTIEVKRRKRTNPQNDFYWGVCVPIIHKGLVDLGHAVTRKDTHEVIKRHCSVTELDLGNGKFIQKTQSTTDMNTVAFNKFLERVQIFGSETLGVYVPDPNEKTEVDFNALN